MGIVNTARIPRVGFLSPVARSSPSFEAFREGLADLGYVEGRNVVIESRFAEGQYEKFPQLAAELLRLDVDLIAVLGAVTARAARKAAPDTPIVFAVVVDPVADHVVESLERPGGNVTGATTFDPLQARKQLELLKQIIPKLTRVALLGDQGVSDALITANEQQARALRLQTLRHRVAGSMPDFGAVFATLRQENADAVLILEEPSVVIHSKRIAELAARDRLPTMFAPAWADAGGLIAFGTSLGEAMRWMGTYVDKVLTGSIPGDLPVQTVTRYELIVNLKTARQIAASIPRDVLERADRVIR
ncbi:putative ABC transport system substrate-binding protein [Paraburkholderia sp. WC7.3g]|uniref:ABC transporter substrate-binding protein n=1 Tax=Paraburkholderia sp. WC7.3g TaxID=2991070 RepID=UPI003D251133